MASTPIRPPHLAGEDGADAQAAVPHGAARLPVAAQAGVLQDVRAALYHSPNVWQ